MKNLANPISITVLALCAFIPFLVITINISIFGAMYWQINAYSLVTSFVFIIILTVILAIDSIIEYRRV